MYTNRFGFRKLELTLTSSRDKISKKYENNPCNIAKKNIKKDLKNMLEIVTSKGSTTDFSKTADYKKYKMYPGQQFYSTNAFGVSLPIARDYSTHHGIYFYGGYILEVASGPKNCIESKKSKKRSKSVINGKSIFGLSDLELYLIWVEKINAKMYKVSTNVDNDYKTIIKRLKRAIKLIGNWKFNILTNNCSHAANYITFGKKSYFYPNGFDTKLIRYRIPKKLKENVKKRKRKRKNRRSKKKRKSKKK